LLVNTDATCVYYLLMKSAAIWRSYCCRLNYIRFQYQNFRARKHGVEHTLTDAMKWLILAIVATVFTVTYLLTFLLVHLYTAI